MEQHCQLATQRAQLREQENELLRSRRRWSRSPGGSVIDHAKETAKYPFPQQLVKLLVKTPKAGSSIIWSTRYQELSSTPSAIDQAEEIAESSIFEKQEATPEEVLIKTPQAGVPKWRYEATSWSISCATTLKKF